MIAKQKGKNPKYPEIIDVWKSGWVVPEWLSDRATVTSITAEGEVTIKINHLSNGGYEIVESGSTGGKSLVKVTDKDGYVCFGEGKLFSLRPIQFNILYEPEK